MLVYQRVYGLNVPCATEFARFSGHPPTISWCSSINSCSARTAWTNTTKILIIIINSTDSRVCMIVWCAMVCLFEHVCFNLLQFTTNTKPPFGRRQEWAPKTSSRTEKSIQVVRLRGEVPPNDKEELSRDMEFALRSFKATKFVYNSTYKFQAFA